MVSGIETTTARHGLRGHAIAWHPQSLSCVLGKIRSMELKTTWYIHEQWGGRDWLLVSGLLWIRSMNDHL